MSWHPIDISKNKTEVVIAIITNRKGDAIRSVDIETTAKALSSVESRQDSTVSILKTGKDFIAFKVSLNTSCPVKTIANDIKTTTTKALNLNDELYWKENSKNRKIWTRGYLCFTYSEEGLLNLEEELNAINNRSDLSLKMSNVRTKKWDAL